MSAEIKQIYINGVLYDLTPADGSGQGGGYTLTEEDKQEIVQRVLAELGSGTPYFYDDVDQRWYDNSDGTYGEPEYITPCPHCGTTLQMTSFFGGDPQETNCPHCMGAITLVDGTVHERTV